MEPTDTTIEILKSIRDELHEGLAGVRHELQSITGRMDRVERRHIQRGP
jgi:hypothetical protein